MDIERYVTRVYLQLSRMSDKRPFYCLLCISRGTMTRAVSRAVV